MRIEILSRRGWRESRTSRTSAADCPAIFSGRVRVGNAAKAQRRSDQHNDTGKSNSNPVHREDFLAARLAPGDVPLLRFRSRLLPNAAIRDKRGFSAGRQRLSAAIFPSCVVPGHAIASPPGRRLQRTSPATQSPGVIGPSHLPRPRQLFWPQIPFPAILRPSCSPTMF